VSNSGLCCRYVYRQLVSAPPVRVLVLMGIWAREAELEKWRREYPTIHLLHQLAHLVLGLFNAHELDTLFVAIMIEEAGIPIPIPGDTLVLLAGTQTPHSIGHTLVAVVGVSSLAVFLGSSVLFAVVQREGRPLLTKYGKYVLLNERRLAQMEAWFARRGRSAVIVGRLIPGLRIPTTIMAGLSGMAYSEFALMAAIAALVWSAFYYTLGSVLGNTAPLVLALGADALDDVPPWLLVLGLLILLAGAGLGATTWRIRQLRLSRLRHLRQVRRLSHLSHLSHPRQERIQVSNDEPGHAPQTTGVSALSHSPKDILL
jgi:membrane protein DedA with SNARE-associated domain